MDVVLYGDQGHDPTSTCCLGPRDAMFRLDFGLLIAVRRSLIELSQERKCMRDRERRVLQVQVALNGWRGRRKLSVGRRPVHPSHSRTVRLDLRADSAGPWTQFTDSIECAALATPRRALDGCGIFCAGRAGRRRGQEARRSQETMRLDQ